MRAVRMRLLDTVTISLTLCRPQLFDPRQYPGRRAWVDGSGARAPAYGIGELRRVKEDYAEHTDIDQWSPQHRCSGMGTLSSARGPVRDLSGSRARFPGLAGLTRM